MEVDGLAQQLKVGGLAIITEGCADRFGDDKIDFGLVGSDGKFGEALDFALNGDAMTEIHIEIAADAIGFEKVDVGQEGGRGIDAAASTMHRTMRLGKGGVFDVYEG